MQPLNDGQRIVSLLILAGLSAAAFVQAISAHLIGRPWPAPLVVAAYDAAAGARVSFDASSGVDLGLAVAASCAMPGVFPPIEITERFAGGALVLAVLASLAVMSLAARWP